MNGYLITAVFLLTPALFFSQQFDLTQLDESIARKKESWDLRHFNEANTAQWSVELSWSMNLWDPTSESTGESLVRNALERNYPSLTPSAFSSAISDMNNQSILGSFSYYSNNAAYLKPRIIRLRHRPESFKRVDFSFGVGSTPALFYATAQEVTSGNIIGMNQTESLAGNYLDQYFYFREIFENWFIERPIIYPLWTPSLIEFGAGFRTSDLVRFHAGLGIVPAGLKAANEWKREMEDPDMPSSTSEYQSVLIAHNMTWGVTITFGAISAGLENRRNFFLTSTDSYINSGAQAQSLPNFTSVCLGYAW